MYMNNKNIKRVLISSILTFAFIAGLFNSTLLAQEKNTAVIGTFNSGIFLENQTVMMYPKKTIELVINHRFGKISDGFSELFGVYSPSNIRMAVNYSVTNKFQLGFGFTKMNKQQDLSWKYSIFEQTTNNKIPVSVVYYGNVVLDARETDAAFNYNNYTYGHRLSYFHEILIARKFCDFFSLQLAPMYAHYNVTESASDSTSVRLRRHDHFGLSALAKVTITPTIAFFAEYDHNFTTLYKRNYPEVKPNLAFGIENATASHSFQLFVTTAYDITNQRNMVYNQNDFLHSGLMIGFNITRVFYR